MIGGIMLFSPSRALSITLEAVRQHPDKAEGIIIGMMAAVDGYEALIGEGMREAEKTARDMDSVPTQTAPSQDIPANDNRPRRAAALTRR